MQVVRDQQEGPQHALLDGDGLVLGVLQVGKALQNLAAQQHRPPDDHLGRKRLSPAVLVPPGIGPLDVQIPAQPGHEIRALAGGEPATLLPATLREGHEALPGSAGEHEDGSAQRVALAVGVELAVLHGRQKMPQPAQIRAVELVPENQGNLPLHRSVARLLEGLGQIRLPFELRQVELQNPLAVQAGAGQLLHREGLARARLAEDRDGQRLRVAQVHLVLLEELPHRVDALHFLTVHGQVASMHRLGRVLEGHGHAVHHHLAAHVQDVLPGAGQDSGQQARPPAGPLGEHTPGAHRPIRGVRGDRLLGPLAKARRQTIEHLPGPATPRVRPAPAPPVHVHGVQPAAHQYVQLRAGAPSLKSGRGRGHQRGGPESQTRMPRLPGPGQELGVVDQKLQFGLLPAGQGHRARGPEVDQHPLAPGQHVRARGDPGHDVLHQPLPGQALLDHHAQPLQGVPGEHQRQEVGHAVHGLHGLEERGVLETAGGLVHHGLGPGPGPGQAVRPTGRVVAKTQAEVVQHQHAKIGLGQSGDARMRRGLAAQKGGDAPHGRVALASAVGLVHGPDVVGMMHGVGLAVAQDGLEPPGPGDPGGRADAPDHVLQKPGAAEQRFVGGLAAGIMEADGQDGVLEEIGVAHDVAGHEHGARRSNGLGQTDLAI